ncbi:MAG TPA: SpoIID/LytB domain-containing protein [Candidatus Angelobacter sp.]|nr:SpoIID/LytB domain-containing protein [Candidatus Angelobacter sp.]
MFLLLLAVLPASAQNTISVRIYSLHPQQQVKIIARSGTLRWRACERCVANEAKQLTVRSAGDQVQIDTETSARADKVFVEGEYRIDPQSGMKIALTAPLEISGGEGLLKLVALMPLEDYVAAALQGESANFKHPESLKAMAVAVRTYAARFRPRHGDEGFDFCDNTHCQNLNFTGPMPSVRAAVAATRGELLWYQGSPAATYYHQNCGGTLAAGEEVWPAVHAPYLREHVDPYCRQGAPLPWKAEFARTEFDKALRDQGLTVPTAWSALEILSRGASGRATRLAFRAPGQEPQLISASTLRFAIGRSFGWNRIRSDLYEIEATGTSITFNGRGAGHGVGLCQAGAEEMARQGQNYRQILAFYYPGTGLGATAQGLNWEKRENAAFELLTTQPDEDAGLLNVAQQILETVQSDLGWKLDFKVQLRVFPTLDAYRNTTGQPGWIAAYTRGHRISLQPVAVLKDKSILESTLRHEFTHLLVEARAHEGTPLWFREGLVLYFADRDRPFAPVTMTEAEMEAALERAASQEAVKHAYAAARTRVGSMVEQYGKETVLGWLVSGLPTAQSRPSQR